MTILVNIEVEHMVVGKTHIQNAVLHCFAMPFQEYSRQRGTVIGYTYSYREEMECK